VVSPAFAAEAESPAKPVEDVQLPPAEDE